LGKIRKLISTAQGRKEDRKGHSDCREVSSLIKNLWRIDIKNASVEEGGASSLIRNKLIF